MTDLTKKDREILTLRAARMSTGSIASLVGRSEAKVYNRLGELGVTTAAQAAAMLATAALPDLSGWARVGGAEFSALLGFVKLSVELDPRAAIVALRPLPPAPAVAKVERHPAPPAPPRSAPLRSAGAVDLRAYLEREIALSGDPDGDYGRCLAACGA